MLFKCLFYKYKNEIKNQQIAFVDDNEWNLSDVKHLPIKLFFANWGYAALQEKHSFRSISSIEEVFS